MRKKNVMIVISIIAVLFMVGFSTMGISVAQERVRVEPKKQPQGINPNNPQNMVHKIPAAKYILHDPSEVGILKTGVQKEIDIAPASFAPDGWYGDFYGTYFISWAGFYLTGSSYGPGLQAPINFPKSAKKIDRIYMFIDDVLGYGSYVGVWGAPIGSTGGYEILWFVTYPGYWLYELDFDMWKISPYDSYYITIGPGYACYHQGIHVIYK